MKIIALIISIIYPLFSFSQKYSCKYIYKPRIPDRSSFLYTESDSSKSELFDTSTQEILIKIIDETCEPYYYGNVIIINNGDTLTLSPDENGIIKTRLSFNNFHLLVNHPSYSLLNNFVPLNMVERTKQVTVVLGKSFRLVRPIIRSNRPLTEKELIEIILQLSQGKKMPKLYKKSICTVDYEI